MAKRYRVLAQTWGSNPTYSQGATIVVPRDDEFIYDIDLALANHDIEYLDGTDELPSAQMPQHDLLSATHLQTNAGDTPEDGDVLIYDGDTGQWVAAPAGAGASSGLFSARPAAGLAGQLYRPTDVGSNKDYVDSGSAFRAWAPNIPLTKPPVVADFTWVNQGTATAVDEQDSIYLTYPAGAPTNNRMLVKAAPATPYVITATFLSNILAASQSSFGLVHRQSSDGKFTYMDIFATAAALTLAVANYTNPTTFSAQPAAISYFPFGPLFFLRMQDTGTNRIYSYSYDYGRTWTVVYTVARTTFETPDQVGFGADSSNASAGGALTLLSWTVG